MPNWRLVEQLRTTTMMLDVASLDSVQPLGSGKRIAQSQALGLTLRWKHLRRHKKSFNRMTRRIRELEDWPLGSISGEL